MSVRLLVFNNGLQILGDYTSKDVEKGAVVLVKPVQVIIAPAEGDDKKSQIGFAPFLPYTDEWKTGLEFMVADILTVATPIVDIVNGYNQMYGSGIVLPPGVSLG